MKINTIELKNVKSFKENTKIDFNEDFNILIGPNGSGKSNLLDILTICIRYYFLKPFLINESNTNQGFSKRLDHGYPFQNINQVLEKFYGDDSDASIIFEFIIKEEDIENINNIVNNITQIESALNEYNNGRDYKHIIDKIKVWDSKILTQNDKITYTVSNNNFNPTNTPGKEKLFLEYLNFFELLIILIKDIPSLRLHTNYLFFSPYRGANLQNLQANLSAQSFYQVLQSLLNTTSKSVFSLINLATIYFAEKRRNFEDEASTEGYIQKWNNDDEVQLVTKYLEKLGYGWNLKLVDKNKNIYEITLTKEDKEFYINQASSGEKEIINFLLGVFAFNINNGIVVIDEPELHLHPRWQNVLLELFIDLSKLTKNQFVLSTHSPTFINDKSLNHIFRIYKDEKNISRKVTLKDSHNFKLKDILHIVNSTNNEKLFFADVVILVEGITDRLVFQKILSEKLEDIDSTKIVEIIEIKGKSNVDNFRKFLDLLKVPNYFISDLDYINEVGDQNIKSLFVTHKRKIQKDVFKNAKSKDGEVLVDTMEESIIKEDFKILKDLWNYVKSFRRKLKLDLTEEEKSTLSEFIENQKTDRNYILSIGDIEDYFPQDYRKKDLLNVLKLLNQEDYEHWKKSAEFKELSEIIDEILVVSKVNSA